ncbi:MAG TPA: threonine synthase [Gaiellaceae bacterium]
MPVSVIRCRVCEAEYEPGAVGVCERCFGPLEPVYDWDSLRVTRSEIEAGPRNIWRYAPLLPVAAPPPSAFAPGMTPLVPAPRLAAALGLGELFVKLDTANPTHSFKDRVVAVASAKAQELGFTTLACSSTGNLANAVAARAAADGLEAIVFCPSTIEREKLVATAVYGATLYTIRGTYDDCSRLVTELAGEVEWGFVNNNLRAYYAEGSKTVAFEIAEQLGWETPDAVVCPVASGSLLTKLWQGFDQFRRVGLADGPAPRIFGGQAEGCSPVAAAFADERRVSPVRPQTRVHSLAIGSPADGDLAVATAQSSGGAIYAVPEDEVGENIELLAEATGVFGEAAAGVTLGALRTAVRRGDLGPSDRVVLCVTGTGLKTPHLVSDSVDAIEIDPDVDALLSELGVAT